MFYVCVLRKLKLRIEKQNFPLRVSRGNILAEVARGGNSLPTSSIVFIFPLSAVKHAILPSACLIRCANPLHNHHDTSEIWLRVTTSPNKCMRVCECFKDGGEGNENVKLEIIIALIGRTCFIMLLILTTVTYTEKFKRLFFCIISNDDNANISCGTKYASSNIF